MIRGKHFQILPQKKAIFKNKTTENKKEKANPKKKPEGIRRYLQAVLEPYENTHLFPVLKSKLKLYENIFHLF